MTVTQSPDPTMWGRVAAWLWPPALDFRERLVTSAGVVGVAICWATAVENAFQGSDTTTIVLNLAAGVATIGLMWFARTTGRYRLTYVVTVIALFVVLFPWFFFAGGGYLGGMPTFFVFAIVFSAYVLEGAALWILLPLELAVFVSCILLALAHPELVRNLSSSSAIAADVIYCVVAAGVALTAALRMLIRLYERNKAELVTRNAELARFDLAKSELLAMVAHELNTPLMVIRAHAEEASRALPAVAADTGQVGPDLAVIESEAERLGRLVTQLLDLARIDEGRLVVRATPENLGAVVQETLRSYRPLVTGQGNSLELERGSAAPVAMVDRERIVQVLVNLLTNASRHTDHGVIRVSVGVAGDMAVVSVADTGEGISADLLEQLGQRRLSMRSEGVRSAKDAGLGVGLMISQHIIAAHGGRFTLESEPGRGTVARFTVPLAERSVSVS